MSKYIREGKQLELPIMVDVIKGLSPNSAHNLVNVTNADNRKLQDQETEEAKASNEDLSVYRAITANYLRQAK